MSGFLETLARDVSYALRTMRKSPAFAGMAVLTLALGIGGTTAMFTVIRSVLLKPLPYRDPDRLAQPSKGATSIRFAEMQAAARSYAGLGAYLQTALDVTLSGDAGPEVVKGMSVSANFLEIMDVQPLLGRGFRSEEDGKGAPPVVLLSEDLWQRRFNGDPAILGRSITLESRACTVIGVLPRGFQFPHPDVDVWVPGPSNYVNTTSPLLSVFGRLHAGVSIEQATAELTVINQHYRTAHPGMLDGKWDGKSNPLERVEPLKDRLVDNVRSMLWILFGAVGFVLLIGCANVASLLLAQAASRSREFAVRSAIGASRRRIINQLLAESVVLAASGGVVGVLLARWGLLAIGQLTALDLPRASEIRLDGMVLGFAVLLSMGTCAIFGLIPSLSASRSDLATVLRASGEAARSTGRKRFGFTLSPRGALVILQVALSMVLLTGAALLMESLGRLYGVNPGFEPSHLLTLRVSLPRTRYDSGRKQLAFFDKLTSRVQALPGVRGAATSWTVPMVAFPMTPVQPASQLPQPLSQRPLAAIEMVTNAYFRTLDVPVKRGREFSEHDAAGDPQTVIINESLARLFWPGYPSGVDPVGQRILIGVWPEPVEIVGVAADMHQVLEDDPLPAIFRPLDQYLAQFPLGSAALLIRTGSDPRQLVNAVRNQVMAIDRDQPITAVQTMEELIAAQGGQRRVILMLLGCFAAGALVLAVIGIYGVIAYSVAQRTPEIGIRRALGAQNVDIVWSVVSHGLALTLAGIVLGIVAALALTRVLASLLFHTSAADAATFLVVALLFLMVALAASFLPALRAAQLDPARALRR